MSDIAERRTQPVTKCTDPTWSLYKGYPGGFVRADLRAQPYSVEHDLLHTALLTLESRLRPPHLSTGSLQSLARDSTFKMRITLSPSVFSPKPAFRCRKHAPRPLVSRGPPNLPPLSLMPLFPTSNLHAARLRDLTCAHLVDVLDGVVREQAGCLLACLMVAELICGGLLRALELPFEPEREGCRAVKGRCGGAFDK